MSNDVSEIRERIVLAADRLFQNRGFQAVGMDEIRGTAEVTLRRMYAEFAGKEQLILAVLNRWHERWTAGLARAVAAVDTPQERLLALFDHLQDWSTDTGFRGNVLIIALAELEATSPAVADLVRAHDAAFRDRVAALVEHAGLPAVLGRQLCLLVEGVQSTIALDGAAGAVTVGRAAAARLIEAADRAR